VNAATQPPRGHSPVGSTGSERGVTAMPGLRSDKLGYGAGATRDGKAAPLSARRRGGLTQSAGCVARQPGKQAGRTAGSSQDCLVSQKI